MMFGFDRFKFGKPLHDVRYWHNADIVLHRVNITSDIDAARRIGYIMAKGLQLLQMKQIEGKVEEEGK